jgi:hypothetical protein
MNDLLLLSDGRCCCSGIDLFAGFDTYFESTYTEAVRRGLATTISIDSIEHDWRPSSTLARFINSRSRLPSVNGRGAGMWDYLQANWNGRSNGNSPDALYGVVSKGIFDGRGFAVYEATDELRELVEATESAHS